MNYYIKVKPSVENSHNAGGKARKDIEKIIQELGYRAITVDYDNAKRQGSIAVKMKYHRKQYFEWKKNCKHLTKGDVLFIQLPIQAHTIYFPLFLKNLRRRGVKTVAIIHDIELLRTTNNKERSIIERCREAIEEKQALSTIDRVITHNEIMTNYLLEQMNCSKSKFVELDIFDYCVEKAMLNEWREHKLSEKTVVVAGNLARKKAGYIYKLPKEPMFRLYGANYEADSNATNVEYMGVMEPEELPTRMEGSFGLVWDGPSAETCEGIWGSYLQFNNPHKTSLYLAAGMPVIIWNQAALADFIIRNNCGITVNSLEEIANKLKHISDADYHGMKECARNIGRKLRNGEQLKTAIKIAEDL